MSKCWQPHQAKKFAKELKLGQSYYVVSKRETRNAPYEDPEVYTEYVFTGRLPGTGNPCAHGNFSAVTLCQLFGPVYDAPPRGMRNGADPAPQVAGPVPPGYRAKLDAAEILALEASVSRGSDPYTREIRGGAAKPKRRFSW